MRSRLSPSIRTSDPQAVTFVELFFDLVFVFAVTQITALTAHDLTPDGILRSIVLGWLIWWAWTQFTWTLNPADTTHPAVRVVTLGATGVALVMAASVTRAFADDALWFAVPYVVVRVLGLGLQVGVDRERADASHTSSSSGRASRRSASRSCWPGPSSIHRCDRGSGSSPSSPTWSPRLGRPGRELGPFTGSIATELTWRSGSPAALAMCQPFALPFSGGSAPPTFVAMPDRNGVPCVITSQ